MPDIDTTYSDQEDILSHVQRHAAIDRDFRERLLNEPRATLSEVAGQSIPEDFTIRFIEKEKGTDALVVLADLVPETMELSPEELQALQGESPTICWWTECLWTGKD